MTIYTPTYHPVTWLDRVVDWCEANLPIISAAFAFGAVMCGAAIFA